MIPLIKSKPGAIINQLHPLANGLIGYWLMKEGSGSGIYDISGKGNHGTLRNMSTNNQLSGWFGSSISFDGTNDDIDCGNDKSLDVTTGFSVSVLIRPTEVASYRTVLSKMITDNAHSTIYLYIYNNIVGLRLYDSSGNQRNAVSSTIYVNNWYHVVGTYNGSSLKLYVNNILVDTELTVPTINVNTSNLFIGSSERWPGEEYQGIIDNIMMHNRGLLTSEVKQLHYEPEAIILKPSILQLYKPLVLSTNLLDGTIKIKKTTTNLTDGLVEIKNSTTNI